MRRIPALLLRSFLQGLLLLSPIALTGYLLYSIFINVDSLLPVAKMPPGLGFVIIICTVTIIGILGTRFFIGKWIFDSFANLLEHTPGVKHIYSSVREVMGSFVGDKRKFNKPVWVKVGNDPEIWRIGFLTQKSMSNLGLEDMVAVYMPHAYAISGWVIMTQRTNIKPVTKMDAAEAMKFAVSGGITFSEDKK